MEKKAGYEPMDANENKAADEAASSSTLLARMNALVDYVMKIEPDESCEDQLKLVQYAVGEDRNFWICPECGAPVTEVGDTCENCAFSRS